MMISLSHGKNRPKAQRFKWATFWQMDCARTRRQPTKVTSLAVPLRLRGRENGLRLHAGKWRVHELRKVRRAFRQDIRKMDSDTVGSCPGHPCTLLALQLRLRNGKSGRGEQSQKRDVGFVRLHDWACRQKTIDQAWYGEQQAVHGLAGNAPALRQSEAQSFSFLRRSRHQRLRALARFCALLAGHGADVSRRHKHRAREQRRRLPARQLHMGREIRAIKEQKKIFAVEIQ